MENHETLSLLDRNHFGKMLKEVSMEIKMCPKCIEVSAFTHWANMEAALGDDDDFGS